ncbi:MAG: class I SAM-dependent methyltransferase [Ideonella sp.]|nr:class I SAM-dependent methyltransferase [Ideonella sp.]MBL0147977.1 class I SAM-dependent methyltransferase [Ideonella sp.]
MTREASIIELGHWLQSPPGQHIVQWEQHQLDLAVADAFGFHALQLGLPQIDALRANRMPHRWVASDSMALPQPMCLPPVDEGLATLSPHDVLALHCDFDALPFPSQSIDLVVLPHALELARDPHETLREVERVLVPEGQVVITGFNPASLWALRHQAGRLRQRMGLGGEVFMPSASGLIGHWRLRDWLKLLSCEVEISRFGCWRPPLNRQRWLDSWGWMDRAGERWWPVLGAVYFVVAVKRVRGMRLVGLARRQLGTGKAAAASVVSQRQNAQPASSTGPEPQ